MANRWGNNGNSDRLISWAPKSLQIATAAMKSKNTCSWKKSYDQPRQHIKKLRYYFADKDPSSQNYDFSSSHVWRWEVDYKESWAQKNWCFWTVVLEKTRVSLRQQGDQTSQSSRKSILNIHWITDAEAETPILWPPDVKNWLTGKDPDAGKDWRLEETGTTDEMVGWHHRLDGHEFEQAPGNGWRTGKPGVLQSMGSQSRTRLSN